MPGNFICAQIQILIQNDLKSALINLKENKGKVPYVFA